MLWNLSLITNVKLCASGPMSWRLQNLDFPVRILIPALSLSWEESKEPINGVSDQSCTREYVCVCIVFVVNGEVMLDVEYKCSSLEPAVKVVATP